MTQAAEKPSERRSVSQGYDSGKRKRTQQRGRQQGCFVYIPAAELARAGFEDAPPFYRITNARRGGVYVQFYREA